jgi:hypothetical protein
VKGRVDIPRSVYPFLQFTASLGSETDTFNYKQDFAKANEFPVAVEDLEVDKVRTIAQEAIPRYEIDHVSG